MKRIGLHPFLLSLTPSLTLLAQNIGQVKPSIALRSLAVSLIASVFLCLLFWLVRRDWRRSAVFTTILLVWIFSYGHIYISVKFVKIAGILVGRHEFLLPLWLSTLALAIWWAAKKLKNMSAITMALNVIAAVLIILPIVLIIQFQIRIQKAWQNRPQAAVHEIQIQDGSAPPDIYYIILDSYARDDILQTEFGYDNTPFLEDLTQMGFYVARCSQSNYAHTELSLASTFNFDYLQALGTHFISSSTDRSDLLPLIKRGAVRQMLEALGYISVAFESGYYWTHWDDADYFLEPPRKGTLSNLFLSGGLNGFEVIYLRSTAGLLLVDFAQKLHLPQELVPDVNYPARKHRERALFVLGQLQFNQVPSLQSPKLVFVHLIVPHAPNVFGPNGEWALLPDEDKNGYRDQVIFINQQIKAIVKDIIQYSDRPPVIVLQGDHGASQVSQDEHMAIFNAYYLPGADPSSLYASISPVNTFRVIFNQYFGGQFPLLEDVSYYSPFEAPYDFRMVPNSRPGCEGK